MIQSDFEIENDVPLPDLGPSGLGQGFRSDLQKLSSPHKSRIVSRQFRDFLLNTFPTLQEDPSLLKGVEYLLFPAKVDPDWDSPIVCCRTVAGFEGKEYKCARNNYGDIKRYLIRLKETVLPGLECIRYNAEKRECGRIKSTGFPFDVEQALSKEVRTPLFRISDPVYLFDGRKANKENRRKMAKLFARDVDGDQRKPASDEVGEALQYLNKRPSNGFPHSPALFEEAYAIADTLPDRAEPTVCNHKGSSTRVNLSSAMSPREVAYRTLRAIEENPKPIYQPGERTARITAVGLNLTNVHSKIRRVLTRGLVEYDLKSAQLAINCADWGVPEVCAFLESGGNVWGTIMGEVFPELPPTDDLKTIVKEAVYSICFGKLEKDVRRTMSCHLNRYLPQYGIALNEATPELSRRFTSYWIVRAMLEAREGRLALIEQDGGAYDDFGNWIEVRKDMDAKSILAQRAQSIEMAMLLPVYRLAQTTKDFTVMLHQHDGFSVAFHSKSRKDRWARRIEEAVREEAQRRGIPTHLEVKSE